MSEQTYTVEQDLRSGVDGDKIIDGKGNNGDGATVVDEEEGRRFTESKVILSKGEEEETGTTVMKQNTICCSDDDETEDDDEDEVEFLFQRKLFEANTKNVNSVNKKYQKKNANLSKISKADEVEVEFLFQRKPKQLHINNNQKYTKRKKYIQLSRFRTNSTFTSSSLPPSSMNKNRTVNINLKPKRPMFQRRLNIVKNRHKQNNPKPFFPPSKKQKKNHTYTNYNSHAFDDLKLEQEKLFGAAKKKMDEDIKAGVLPQSNSQIPRTEVPYNDKKSKSGTKKMLSVIKKHYKELGLKHLSSLKEVKTKFRELALTAHPDKYKVKAANDSVKRLRNDRWIKISMAYHQIIEFLKASRVAEEL